MKILVAGASGAIGRRLVPLLVEAGHDVAGMTRSESKRELVRGLGAEPIVANALDAAAVADAVALHHPDVIVHQLTAISKFGRNFDRSFAETNRLRTEATDHLLAAGRAIGVKRFVAQSFAGWPVERSGPPVQDETAPFDPDPLPSMRASMGAIRHVEAAVLGADWTEGVVLRYGGFYGPGTSLDLPDRGDHLEAVRKRQMPIIGDGTGVWSFIHIDDAAAATAIAVERGPAGLYNIVDDAPMAVKDWLPPLAAAIGAKPPRKVPRWVGRLLAGEAVTVMMTEVRGASNAKAKAELGWSPTYPSLLEAVATLRPAGTPRLDPRMAA
jgi:nucleoside-diphosphate-sugar epimerase